MFSEGFRQVPRKLIRLTIENPTALWVYCYLVDKMDDRLEMTCTINVTLTANIVGIPKTTLIRLMQFLVQLEAISIVAGRKGYTVKALNYQNNPVVKAWSENGPKTVRNLVRNVVRKIELEDSGIKDIFGEHTDIVGPTFGPTFGPTYDQNVVRNGGVLDSIKKERKKKEYSLSTASVDSADSQDETKTPWLTLVNHWNDNLPTHQKVLVSMLRKNEKRKKAITAIIDTVGMNMLFDVIKGISESDFLNKKWKPKFEWITKIDNVQKVIEGNYKDTKETTKKVELTDFSRRSL